MKIFPTYVVSQTRINDTLEVKFSDSTVKHFNIYDLCVEWLYMTNDDFYNCYGFNFNPHNFDGVYKKGIELAHRKDNEQ